jgi:hypothetical protein
MLHVHGVSEVNYTPVFRGLHVTILTDFLSLLKVVLSGIVVSVLA